MLLLLLYGISTDEATPGPPAPTPGAFNTLRTPDTTGGGGQLRHHMAIIYPNVHQWARRDEEELELMR